MERTKMSVTQLTLLTSLSMMGAGIIMLPVKLAEIGTISMLSWLLSGFGAGALAYVFAQCGMLTKRPGGLGGFASYAFGPVGSFMVNYTYALSLVVGNVAIALAAVNYGLSYVGVEFSPLPACASTIWLLIIASALNLRSPNFTGKITALFVWALLLPLLFFVAFGWLWFDPAIYADNWNPHNLTVVEAIPESVSMTFWAFLGLESACANSDSVGNPERNVPLAVIAATLFTAFIYIVSTNLCAGIVPNAAILTSDAPFGVVYASMFGENARHIVTFLLWIGCAGSVVSWQFTMSRVFVSSARLGYFPKIFAEVTRRDVARKGFAILTTVQALLCVFWSVSSSAYSLYERLSDFAVFITLFAFVLSMSGSFALAKQECDDPKRVTKISMVGLFALAALLLSIYCLDVLILKLGTISLLIGWVLYGILRVQPFDEDAEKSAGS